MNMLPVFESNRIGPAKTKRIFRLDDYAFFTFVTTEGDFDIFAHLVTIQFESHSLGACLSNQI